MSYASLQISFFNPETIVRRCSVENVFLKNWQNSRENTCVRTCFFNKVAGGASQVTSFFNKVAGDASQVFSHHRCFRVNFEKFLRASILKNIYEWLHVLILLKTGSWQRKTTHCSICVNDNVLMVFLVDYIFILSLTPHIILVILLFYLSRILLKSCTPSLSPFFVQVQFSPKYFFRLLRNIFSAISVKSMLKQHCSSTFTGFELNFVKRLVKFLKAAGNYLPWRGLTMLHLEKLTLLDALKMHVHRFFALNE